MQNYIGLNAQSIDKILNTTTNHHHPPPINRNVFRWFDKWMQIKYFLSNKLMCFVCIYDEREKKHIHTHTRIFIYIYKTKRSEKCNQKTLKNKTNKKRTEKQSKKKNHKWELIQMSLMQWRNYRANNGIK